MRRVRLENDSAKKNWPARLQPAERPLPAFHAPTFGGNSVQRRGTRSVLGIQARIRLRSVKQWPKLPVVSSTSCDARCIRILPRMDGGVS